MSILTGFTRPIDPIIGEDMRAWIASQTSLVITYVEMHPTTIDVTGTIVSGNTTAIQSAINSYVCSIPTTGLYVPIAAMSNTSPMLDDETKLVTSHAALTSDNVVLGVANSKISSSAMDTDGNLSGNSDASLATQKATKTYVDKGSSKVYDSDTLKVGPFIRWYKTVTTLGGSATYNPTSDGTSTGTALFQEIFSNSIQTQTQDGSNVYAPGAVTVAGNLKSVAVAYTKQVFGGIVLLSTNILGSVTTSAIPDGVSIRAGMEGR